MNVYLIGYRCTGKTGVGKELARRMGWTFVDADDRITGELGISIADFVRGHGWEAFRDVEQAVMARMARTDRAVVAAGGGVVLRRENVTQMKRHGRVVWLRAAPETIAARMLKDPQTAGNRPSLTGKDVAAEIAEVLEERSPLYRRAADIAIDTDEKSVDNLVADILDILPQQWYRGQK